jgi:hypothetical protein
MKNAIINEFVLDGATNSATDWVVTFPTKGFYALSDGSAVSKPFQNKVGTKGSCDDIVLNTWDREEQTTQPGGPDFSPAPTTPGAKICWEANVVTFNSKNVFSSSQTLGVATLFINGWARMDFHKTPGLVATQTRGVDQASDLVPTIHAAGTTFTGLPVIGFAVQTFRPTLTSSYAGTFYHRYIPGTPPILK